MKIQRIPKAKEKTLKLIVTVSQITSHSWAEIMINKGFLDVEKFTDNLPDYFLWIEFWI